MKKGKYIFFAIFAVWATTTSCDKLFSEHIDLSTDNNENCDCEISEEPETYDVKLKVTINDKNPEVPITIFFGSIERNNVATTLTATNALTTVNLKLNHDYTYMAKYLKGSDTVYVPVKSRLKKSVYLCHDDSCWTIDNSVINLKLK
ncbi:MAG: hypothetical protein J6Z01_13695 [Bacteroidales bacterium]|nr:hypothetical protein [Bacteroidales bacterium]